MWTFWNRPKKAAQVLFLWALFWQLFPAGLLCEQCWDNKSMEPQFMENISGMQFVQWELILRSTLSFDNFRQRLWGLWDCAWCAWKIPSAQELCNESISMGTIWIGKLPCVWSYTQNCGFQILITWMCFFFFGGGVMSVYVHGDFTHAVNEVFVFVCFCSCLFRLCQRFCCSLSCRIQWGHPSNHHFGSMIRQPNILPAGSETARFQDPFFSDETCFYMRDLRGATSSKCRSSFWGNGIACSNPRGLSASAAFWFRFFSHRSCLYKMDSKTS